MSVSRKRKKELRHLQDQASRLWASQQVLASEAADVARHAGRQLGHYGREQVAPQVQAGYERYAAPYVDRGVRLSQHVLNDRVVPAAGAVVGSALSLWDAANDTRGRLASGRGIGFQPEKISRQTDRYAKNASKALASRVAALQPDRKKGIGAGRVIAIVFGVAAAAGVLYAAWQTLRADDELWVADDPLHAPEA